MRWLGTACFELLLNDHIGIVIDPYMDDSVSAPLGSAAIESCDYILITHGHYDHLLDVGKLCSRFDPGIICSRQAAESLHRHQGIERARMHAVSFGDRLELPGIKLEVLKGRHNDSKKEYQRITGNAMPEAVTNGGALDAVKYGFKTMSGTDWLPERFDEWMTMYPAGDQLNYVIDPGGGKRVYMAGTAPDPDIIEEARKAKAYITLLQVLNGDKLKGMEEATMQLALASGCKVAVPQHHDPLLKGAKPTDLAELKRLFKLHTNIELMEFVPGRWHRF